MKTIKSDNIRQFFIHERDARTFPISGVITYPKIGVAGTVKLTEVENIDGLVALIAQAERHDG